MEFLKDKAFYIGMFTSFLWTSFGVLIFTYFMSQQSIELSLKYLYQKNQLGGLISLGALLNLPIFFLAIRKNKVSFATGIVCFSLLIVVVVALLKMNL
ncbi:MAG: hypothetical protein PVJ91_04600 [Flavobacteriaceae bacterium]|jgi:hypothetical protein